MIRVVNINNVNVNAYTHAVLSAVFQVLAGFSLDFIICWSLTCTFFQDMPKLFIALTIQPTLPLCLVPPVSIWSIYHLVFMTDCCV